MFTWDFLEKMYNEADVTIIFVFKQTVYWLWQYTKTADVASSTVLNNKKNQGSRVYPWRNFLALKLKK